MDKRHIGTIRARPRLPACYWSSLSGTVKASVGTPPRVPADLSLTASPVRTVSDRRSGSPVLGSHRSVQHLHAPRRLWGAPSWFRTVPGPHCPESHRSGAHLSRVAPLWGALVPDLNRPGSHRFGVQCSGLWVLPVLGRRCGFARLALPGLVRRGLACRHQHVDRAHHPQLPLRVAERGITT